MNILLIVLGLWGCTPKYIPEPIDPSDWIGKGKCDTTLKLLWQEPVYKDSIETAVFLYLRDGKFFYQLIPGDEEKRPGEIGFFEIIDNKFHFLSSYKGNSDLGIIYFTKMKIHFY